MKRQRGDRCVVASVYSRDLVCLCHRDDVDAVAATGHLADSDTCDVTNGLLGASRCQLMNRTEPIRRHNASRLWKARIKRLSVCLFHALAQQRCISGLRRSRTQSSAWLPKVVETATKRRRCRLRSIRQVAAPSDDSE